MLFRSERYKTNGVATELDYISSCFNKFGAIHKLPYAWILKMGSVWYRYKNYIENNVDILDTVWTNFNYLNNFDPVTSDKTRTYKFKRKNDGPTLSISLENRNQNVLQIQTGFYPKLMNDFAYFYNGKDLFSGYTDQEIQSAVYGGLRLYQFPNSEFNAKQNNDKIGRAHV